MFEHATMAEEVSSHSGFTAATHARLGKTRPLKSTNGADDGRTLGREGDGIAEGDGDSVFTCGATDGFISLPWKSTSGTADGRTHGG
jgi:hypothetical protein